MLTGAAKHMDQSCISKLNKHYLGGTPYHKSLPVLNKLLHIQFWDICGAFPIRKSLANVNARK